MERMAALTAETYAALSPVPQLRRDRVSEEAQSIGRGRPPPPENTPPYNNKATLYCRGGGFFAEPSSSGCETFGNAVTTEGGA